MEELVRLNLIRPVRLFVDSNTDVADNLQQEFVRVKAKREGDREAIVAALCCRTFREQCLLFFPTKRLTHRMRIVFGLLGLKAAELHGNLTQLQVMQLGADYWASEASPTWMRFQYIYIIYNMVRTSGFV